MLDALNVQKRCKGTTKSQNRKAKGEKLFSLPQFLD